MYSLLQILSNRPMSIAHDSSDLKTDWRDSEFITECLCWHNVYRQRHNAPPLTMSPEVKLFYSDPLSTLFSHNLRLFLARGLVLCYYSRQRMCNIVLFLCSFTNSCANMLKRGRIIWLTRIPFIIATIGKLAKTCTAVRVAQCPVTLTDKRSLRTGTRLFGNTTSSKSRTFFTLTSMQVRCQLNR